MYKKKLLRTVSLVTILFAFSALGRAQAGVCKDPWVTQAFHQMYQRAPIGSGTTGECDITRYGNGHWSSYQDLMTKIAQHGTGSHAMPSAAAPQTSLVRTSPGSQPAATVKPVTGPGLMNSGGNGIVAQGGGNIISQDGNGIVAQGGGNIISQDGNGMRSTLSVDKPRAPSGKYLVIPGGNLVDANGNIVRRAGTYMLLYKNGNYSVGTGVGARTPTAGTVVAP